MTLVKRHFIAGAVCPACGLEDKLQLCRDGEREWINCVRCDYIDQRPTEVIMKEPDQPTSLEVNGVVKFVP